MKHISIIVPEGGILGSLEGSRQLFTQVNHFSQMQGGASVFKVQLVGLSKMIKSTGGLFTIHTDAVIDDIQKTDLIIIPALDGEITTAVKQNEKFIPWIRAQYGQGAEVASLCLGAFLLAATGLIEGKKCATHWMAENTFRSMYPKVQLVTQKVITDENGIYSSGGAFSYLNLILHLIEKYAGREMAILSAKTFAIEFERQSQLSFSIFQGQKDHVDEPIKKTQEFIESNFQQKISVDELANRFALGRRNLERRFKKATSNTLVEYIQRVKIEAAKKSFETTQKNINEVMYDVGYSDTKAFRETFKKITGLSPVQYKNKYNRELAV